MGKYVKTTPTGFFKKKGFFKKSLAKNNNQKQQPKTPTNKQNCMLKLTQRGFWEGFFLKSQKAKILKNK